ncbi:MAG: tyrosine-type recombinase/integrase [Clostridiales bacterium]|nr:tyrosine-type recombinase/integrase [Clostridiales bacterium]
MQRRLQDVLQQIRQDQYCEPSQITLEQWMRQWWEVYSVPNCRKNTSATTRAAIETHIIPELGKIPLQKLRVEKVQAFINVLNRKNLAPSTIKRISAVLKMALKQAVINHLIIRNPAENVILPKIKQKEIAFLSQDERRRLLAALPDTDNARAIRFLLGTGLRASEMIGLRWKDIDKNSFHIRQAITSYNTFMESKKYAISIDAPKSAASNREIPLMPSMLALLEEQRKKQNADKEKALAMGIGWKSGDLVFSTVEGSPKGIRNLRRTLVQALNKAGLPHRGLHALRHTFATDALQAGMDVRTLSEIIGHTKIAFTLQTYVHSNMDTKRKALEAMESAAL